VIYAHGMMEHVLTMIKYVLISQMNQNVKMEITAIGIYKKFVKIFLFVQITQSKIAQQKNGVQNYLELVKIIILLYVLNLCQYQLARDLSQNQAIVLGTIMVNVVN